MRFSLEEIFEQSIGDNYAADVSSRGFTARVVYGIKLVKDLKTDKIKVYNTAKSGDYYQEVEEEEYSIFLEKGWRYGVYVLSLNNIRLKLDKIEGKIKQEVNGRLSKKAILGWKSNRASLMARYSKITKKLNQLKSE